MSRCTCTPPGVHHNYGDAGPPVCPVHSLEVDESMRRLVASIARMTGTPVELLSVGMGTPERFVLWGGRVGRDAWVGSLWDQMAQVRLRRAAQVRRAQRLMAEHMAEVGRSFAQVAKAAEQTMRQFRQAIQAGGAMPPEV